VEESRGYIKTRPESSTVIIQEENDMDQSEPPEEGSEYVFVVDGYICISDLYQPEKRGHEVVYFQHGPDGLFSGTTVTATMCWTGGPYITVSGPSRFEYFLTGNIMLRKTFDAIY
jgi:hypothetical protein